MHIGAHIYLCFKPWKTQILVSFSSKFIQQLGFTEWLDPYPKSGVLSGCFGGKTLAEIHQTPQGALGGTGLWVSRPESTPQSAKKTHTTHHKKVTSLQLSTAQRSIIHRLIAVEQVSG